MHCNAKRVGAKSLATCTLAGICVDVNTQAHIGMYATPLGEITFDMDRDIVQTIIYPV